MSRHSAERARSPRTNSSGPIAIRLAKRREPLILSSRPIRSQGDLFRRVLDGPEISAGSPYSVNDFDRAPRSAAGIRNRASWRRRRLSGADHQLGSPPPGIENPAIGKEKAGPTVKNTGARHGHSGTCFWRRVTPVPDRSSAGAWRSRACSGRLAAPLPGRRRSSHARRREAGRRAALPHRDSRDGRDR
jgi:hypothetical protein